MIKKLFIKCKILEIIIIDRENFFISKYWSTFCYHLKFALRYNIAFHSQTNDQTKRQNQTLEQYFRNYVNYQQNDWTSWLAFVEYAYNNSHHDSINMSSFQALYVEFIKWENTVQIATNAEIFAIKLRAKQTLSYVFNSRRVDYLSQQNNHNITTQSTFQKSTRLKTKCVYESRTSNRFDHQKNSITNITNRTR